MIYLDKEDIIFINQRTVAEHGGNFMPPNNFLHEENLDYLLEAVQAELFGEPMYPTVAERRLYTVIASSVITSFRMGTNVRV